MMRLGGPAAEETAAAAPATAATAAAAPAAQPDFSTPYNEAARHPRDRVAHPDLVARYGLDPTRQWTNQDIIDKGYRGPQSLAEQQKFIDEENPKDRARLSLAYDFEVIRRAIQDPRVLPELGGGGVSVSAGPFSLRTGPSNQQTQAEAVVAGQERHAALRAWLGLSPTDGDPTERALTARQANIVRQAGSQAAENARRDGMTAEQVDQMRGITEQRFASAIKSIMIIRGESNASQSDADVAGLLLASTPPIGQHA